MDIVGKNKKCIVEYIKEQLEEDDSRKTMGNICLQAVGKGLMQLVSSTHYAGNIELCPHRKKHMLGEWSFL